MKLEFSPQIFEKYPNVKFNENPFSGSRVVPCGQTDGRTEMTKLIVSFRNFAKAPKKQDEEWREAGINEKKEKETLPKRRKIIARHHGITVQKTLIFTFLPRHCGSMVSLFLRNRQVTRSNTGPKPDILTVVVMVFLDLSREMFQQ